MFAPLCCNTHRRQRRQSQLLSPAMATVQVKLPEHFGINLAGVRSMLRLLCARSQTATGHEKFYVSAAHVVVGRLFESISAADEARGPQAIAEWFDSVARCEKALDAGWLHLTRVLIPFETKSLKDAKRVLASVARTAHFDTDVVIDVYARMYDCKVEMVHRLCECAATRLVGCTIDVRVNNTWRRAVVKSMDLPTRQHAIQYAGEADCHMMHLRPGTCRVVSYSSTF